LLGYTRVFGDDDRESTLQVKALRAVGCSHIFKETSSSARGDPPELRRLLNRLRKGDTVVVLKLSCLSPSLKDVLRIMMRIAATDAGFRSIVEEIDTTTSAGPMVMRLIRALVALDSAAISKRTIAGLAAASAEGRIAGRPRKLDSATERKIAESVLSGAKSGAAMARHYGVHKGTISRIVEEHRITLSGEGEFTRQKKTQIS
jgi:DNA invertase Pin-like site-specific DNA recombinase